MGAAALNTHGFPLLLFCNLQLALSIRLRAVDRATTYQLAQGMILRAHSDSDGHCRGNLCKSRLPKSSRCCLLLELPG